MNSFFKKENTSPKGFLFYKAKDTNYTNDKEVEKTGNDNKIFGSESSGIVYSNVSNASTNYGMDKFNTPKGHGFAAENANHLFDKLTGNSATLVGEHIDPETGRIVKNGADRVVNGVNIQTKYCRTGSDCISECFDSTKKFRYLNPDGSPMQIEVPSDKHEAAIQAMKNRIKQGQVPGVTNPDDAEKIVKKGQFTYEQAKNIAKAGTVDSLKFDAQNGMIIGGTAFGISAVLSFAVSIWNGDDFNTAIKVATYSGLKVGGTAFATAILSSQLSRLGVNSMLVGSSEAIVNLMGPKAASLLVNSFRSGTNIYGAAAIKSASKLLRGNVITGAVSVAVLSSIDVVNIFRGRISGAQLFKNVAKTTSSVAGGTAGWVGGAAAGAALGSAVPIIGTAIGAIAGGIIGSFTGGSIAGKVSSKILDEFIEDDANKMVKIIEQVFTQLAQDYLLTASEAEAIVAKLQNKLTSATLKEMFSSNDRHNFAHHLLISHVNQAATERKKIKLPTLDEMNRSLKAVLEEISDNTSLA